jgi:hypothetical protein
LSGLSPKRDKKKGFINKLTRKEEEESECDIAFRNG